MLKPGINECSNKDYHADTEYLSSSNIKLLLKDLPKFYKEKILGQKEQKENPNFDIGSYVHSLILEPHMTDLEFAYYSGWTKRGAEFDAFKKENFGKTIISAPQRIKCLGYLDAYKKRKEATSLLVGGLAELTICADIEGISMKMRADYINIDAGYIADVKTTGYSADHASFSLTAENLFYKLSGALYTAIAEKHFGKKFDFYFIVISKVDNTCEVYKLSDASKEYGYRGIMDAAKIYKKCKATGIWENTVQKPVVLADYEILEV